MISGATRGQGIGDALARHLLKAENDRVVVIPARGLGSTDLVEQVRELVALSAGGRTDRPVYHVHLDPDVGIADEAAARTRWWSLFEGEFGLSGQPYCGVEHVKGGRAHEHRVYSLVRPAGSIVDLSWDYARREKCSRIVELEFGMRAVASRHARAIERRLRQEGQIEVADWLERSGTTKAPRPVAPLTPAERLQQVRTGSPLDAVRLSALAAWRESHDAAGFVAGLRARGLDLRRGRKGLVIVDEAGGTHLATRVIGAAARRHEGQRILAAAVHERLAGMALEEEANGRDRNCAAPRRAGEAAASDRRSPRTGADRARRVGLRRPDRDPGRLDRGGGGRGDHAAGDALQRLRASSPGQRIILRRRLNAFRPGPGFGAAAARARDSIDRIESAAARDRDRAWALWGLTDMWGLPLT